MASFLVNAFASVFSVVSVGAQGSIAPLIFSDTTTVPVIGNYTVGYINNTLQNRCQRGITKFSASQTGTIDTLSTGLFSRINQENCGISFVLATFPDNVGIGNPLLTSNLTISRPGTYEFLTFNASSVSWTVVAGMNYTLTILPLVQRCMFDVFYGRPGFPYVFYGEYGPKEQPCGAVPWVNEIPDEGFAMQLKLTGYASASPSNLPTASSTVTPTPTASSTVTPSSSISLTPTASSTVTPTSSYSHTPTASSTVTPTSSYSHTPTESALVAMARSVAADGLYSTGIVIGAAVGGAITIIILIALAIRFRVVSAQLNSNKVNTWGVKKVNYPLKNVAPKEDMDTVVLSQSPLKMRSARIVEQR